jgi:hypothetical protein
MNIEQKSTGEQPMKLEERVIDEDRVEYGIGNGLYLLCVRDPRSGKVLVTNAVFNEAGGPVRSKHRSQVRRPCRWRHRRISCPTTS